MYTFVAFSLNLPYKIAGGGAVGIVYTRGPTDTDTKYKNVDIISYDF